MLVSCRWLKDYADYNISEVELADRRRWSAPL